MNNRIKILEKIFWSAEDIQYELETTEKLIQEKRLLSKNMKWISSEAIRQGVSFDEICIKLDYELTTHKTHLEAYRNYLNKDHHVIVCTFCNQKLRIKDFENCANLSCPKCNCNFTLTKDYIGKIKIQSKKSNSYSSDDKKPEWSENKINSYFDLLGIHYTASLDEAKKAYRTIITQYHPDKVSHLGIEFQRLAESKTKELNEAYCKLCNYLK
jgi:uncharacterized C2H2 Zn-finger protein